MSNANPFVISAAANSISNQYLTPDELKNKFSSANDFEKKGFIQQWVSEGIPFAYKDRPLLYEVIRIWLAEKLKINAKEVTLIGSARVGFSLAPTPSFGRAFCGTSDLDFSIVSHEIFSNLSKEFTQFSEDYTVNRIAPKNTTERTYWDENKKNVPQNIAHGFIDSYKIPNRYDNTRFINNCRYILTQKIKATPEHPHIRTASFRFYKNWDSFINRVLFNLRWVLQQA